MQALRSPGLCRTSQHVLPTLLGLLHPVYAALVRATQDPANCLPRAQGPQSICFSCMYRKRLQPCVGSQHGVACHKAEPTVLRSASAAW
eukprot:scaffold1269_cov400-Prasinococcus_capsulatus_cf.AAC.4